MKVNYILSLEIGIFSLYILLLMINYTIMLLGALFVNMWHDILSLILFLAAMFIARKNIILAEDL